MELKIEGEQINLRKLKKSDAPAIYQNANDKLIAKYTELPHPYKLDDAYGFIRATHQKLNKKKAFELGIELKETKEIIGMISLMKVDYDNKNAEIGYWLGKKYWGRKIMKEAIKLFLNFGFNKVKLTRIYAKVMHPNISSAKLLEKSGFQYEGRMRKATLKDGKWMDALMYSILNSEFKSKQRRII
jgi:RimJ/RimL family protein N-acetyltransferase